ncbi:MAG: HAD family phosphatase [Reinekea sp.]|jgi:HAD superfamily hydrolase (TIGR01509 family)
MIKAVLWDMDGVLVDSERLVRDIFVELMSDADYMDDPEAVFMQSIGLNTNSILSLYETYMPSRKEAEFYYYRIGDIYRERIGSDLQLKPGVTGALDAVAALNLPQMVVTSSRQDVTRAKLDQFSLLPYFEDLICGDQVSQGKPHPEPYLTACERLGVEPAHALIIEDSPNGVKAGLSAGSMVIHVPDLIETNPQWQDELLDALDSLESFPEWLNRRLEGSWL